MAGRYFFAPCTRALEVYWLCRNLAGSGVPDDPLPEYREEYLKDDMGFPCWSGEHLPVLVLSIVLWLAYAISFPLALAWVINKDRKATAGSGKIADADDAEVDATFSGGSGYWHSTRPLIEKFWFPLVAHLQPRVSTLEDARQRLPDRCLSCSCVRHFLTRGGAALSTGGFFLSSASASCGSTFSTCVATAATTALTGSSRWPST